MKRLILCVFLMSISLVFYAQENELSTDFNVDLCIKHRTDELSNQCFSSSKDGLQLQYLKSGEINSPRQYSIKVPDDCIMAKIKFVEYKDGVEVDSREQSFSKSDKANSFSFSQNPLMGPYMKPKGETEVKIIISVYKKTEDGYVKIDKDLSTISIMLNQEKELLAENN